MNKCTVVNKYKEPFDVYIGRGSKWGNPYSHQENTLAQFKVETREESIEKYKEYLLEGEGKRLLNDLHELKGKKLGCYCKPKTCHGDILAQLTNEKFKPFTLFVYTENGDAAGTDMNIASDINSKIQYYIENKQEIVLDFTNIDWCISDYLGMIICPLYVKFSSKTLNTYLSIKNVNKINQRILTKIIELEKANSYLNKTE